MIDVSSFLTFEFIGKVVKIVFSSFLLFYSAVIFRDVLDLQTFYESKFNPLFKIIGILTIVGSLILLITSFN